MHTGGRPPVLRHQTHLVQQPAVLTSRKHVRKQDTYKVVIACSALQLKAFKRVIPKPLFLVTEDWGSVTVFSPP